MDFRLVSDYRPSGDQPQAIEGLVNGVNWGLREQTLLGVTGSGKTFTMASVIEKLNRPTSSSNVSTDQNRFSLDLSCDFTLVVNRSTSRKSLKWY